MLCGHPCLATGEGVGASTPRRETPDVWTLYFVRIHFPMQEDEPLLERVVHLTGPWYKSDLLRGIRGVMEQVWGRGVGPGHVASRRGVRE